MEIRWPIPEHGYRTMVSIGIVCVLNLFYSIAVLMEDYDQLLGLFLGEEDIMNCLFDEVASIWECKINLRNV